MPDDILGVVQAGVEVAKTIRPQRFAPAEDIPENEADFYNVKNDIAAALGEGERFLSEADAAKRRAEIRAAQQAQAANQ